MRDTTFPTVEEDTSTSLAVVEVEAESAPTFDTSTGPRCEKCDAPIQSVAVTICRHCGWYASLGMFVEIDPKWESEEDGAPSAEPHGQASDLQAGAARLPWWGWVMVGSVLAVVVESVIVRLVTPPAIGGLRTSWSLTQLALGAGLLAGCHLFNFFAQAAHDADMGVLDVVLRPLKVWLRAFGRLPNRLWVVNAAACGLTAIVMSLLVIGAIPYDRLWDWGITPPPKQNLMAAVMDRTKTMGGPGADNLEEAIGDFAGRGELDGDSVEAPPAPPPKRETADCVVVGYRVDKDGRITQLLLGTAHLGKLIYACTVSAPNDGDDAARLKRLLDEARSHRRYLPIQADAIWVTPSHACRVTFAERRSDGRLIDAEWETYLGELRM